MEKQKVGRTIPPGRFLRAPTQRGFSRRFADVLVWHGGVFCLRILQPSKKRTRIFHLSRWCRLCRCGDSSLQFSDALELTTAHRVAIGVETPSEHLKPPRGQRKCHLETAC